MKVFTSSTPSRIPAKLLRFVEFLEIVWLLSMRGFYSRAGQTECSDANGSPPLRCSFGAMLHKRQAAKMNPATRYTLRRIIASMMKNWKKNKATILVYKTGHFDNIDSAV